MLSVNVAASLLEMLAAGEKAYLPCGKPKVLERGLCQTCYTLKRQDQSCCGGHLENVLKRHAYRCSVPRCSTIKRAVRDRWQIIHHREPGNSDPAKLLTLCLPCHAKVSRTLFVQDEWPEFLRVLWREQHPEGHEQVALNFGTLPAPATNVMLFKEMPGIKACASINARARRFEFPAVNSKPVLHRAVENGLFYGRLAVRSKPKA